METKKPGAPDPVIELQGVTVARNGRPILENIDLVVRRGEHWAILGPNGCGKTTLLNVIAAYLWPTEGTVRVLGDRYGTVDVRGKRRRMGFVSSALFERIPPRETFLDVVASGRRASLGTYDEPDEEDYRKARRITESLGCGHVSGRPYGSLSFGERQKALIGRALMADPGILMLDEPCEGLDIRSRENIVELMERTTRGVSPTLLLVTHRVEEIPPGTTHAALMNGGRMILAGAKNEVLTSGNVSEAMETEVEILRRDGRFIAVPGRRGRPRVGR